MKMNEQEEQEKFRQTLNEFLVSNGILDQPEKDFTYDPFRLYQLVCRRGGFHAVTNRKVWKEIGLEMGASPEPIRSFYQHFIFPFEKRNYFGEEGTEEEPTVAIGMPRKIGRSEGSLPGKTKGQDFSGLTGEIARALQEQEQTRKIHYLRKSHLTLTKPEVKKIALGLDPFAAKQDRHYSLNMLTVFSVNAHHPFLFENYQKLFSALSNYMQAIYPPQGQQDLEYLRTVTLIFRNLTLNPVNLKFILGTSVFQLLVQMFNTGLDSECSKNIVDIMNGLVKVGWDCQQILKEIDQAILDDKIEEVQWAVQLLRGLIDQRDQQMAPTVTKHLKALLRVLMSSDVNIQTKEQVFEILVFVTDISSQSRQQLLRNKTLVSLIIGILQQMKNQEKLVQSAALTLSNMSSSASAKVHLRPYESELMLIGFSDDSLAGIISAILAELSH